MTGADEWKCSRRNNSVKRKNSRHANCRWEESNNIIHKWWHTCTHRLLVFTSDSGSWLVLIICFFVCFFVLKSHYIGRPLLCSTSVQWWHHSVWDVAAIFSIRQCAVPAASPASAPGTGMERDSNVVDGQIKLAWLAFPPPWCLK